MKDDRLQLLRDILLIDDREVANAITKRLQTITETIETRDRLSEKIDPIIEERLKSFVKEIPNTLGPTITQTLKEQIVNSRDEVVDALYPIMGKMIKKYIQSEMKMLSEEISSKMNKTFSFKKIKQKIRFSFAGVKESDVILANLHKPIVNELFIIEKGSGLLKGHFSSTQSTVDKDLVSGMLTAIKSFVEDAFNSKSQNLENISYELYTIHIQNFHSFYIAAVCTGPYTNHFQSKLESSLLKFSEKFSGSIDRFSSMEIEIILKEFCEGWKLFTPKDL